LSLWLAWDNNEMSMATPHFRTMPNLDMPRSTWSDVGQTSRTENGGDTNRKWKQPMSGDVGPCRQCHIWVGHGRKCGGSLWNRVAIFFRSKVIFTSGFASSPFWFPMSADVGPCRQRHNWVGNGRQCGGSRWTASPSLSVKKLFLLPVPTAILNSDSRHRRRPCSMLGLSKAMIPRHDQML